MTLPTRVLDIGSQGDIIKLIDVTNQTGKYASLSYYVRHLSKVDHFSKAEESLKTSSGGNRSRISLPETT